MYYNGIITDEIKKYYDKEDITLVKEEVIPEEKIIANDLDQKVDLINEIMKDNVKKLHGRKERGTLSGSGDNR